MSDDLLNEFWLDDDDIPNGWVDWAASDDSNDSDDYSADLLAELLDDSDDFLEELLHE